VQKLDTKGMPPQAFLGAAGMPGLTAYAGLLRVAALKEGDLVFVSGGAGAVGSMVVQIAKAKGHTVVASAGGAEKVAFLKIIGADHVIDYKAEKDLTAALMRAAPDGIDVYFDNVGGEHLEAALTAARPFGRFAMCGAISMYNATEPPPGPRNLFLVVGKQLKLEGFIVSTHWDMLADFHRDLAQWVKDGKVTWKETVFEGIEKAPDAFRGLFSGENLGKMLVKLG
jgi:NADPH-dependent curcumin reductase CurA